MSEYTHRRSPFGPEISEKDRRLAEEVAKSYEESERRAHQARAREVNEIAKIGQGRIRDLVGADTGSPYVD